MALLGGGPTLLVQAWLFCWQLPVQAIEAQVCTLAIELNYTQARGRLTRHAYSNKTCIPPMARQQPTTLGVSKHILATLDMSNHMKRAPPHGWGASTKLDVSRAVLDMSRSVLDMCAHVWPLDRSNVALDMSKPLLDMSNRAF